MLGFSGRNMDDWITQQRKLIFDGGEKLSLKLFSTTLSSAFAYDNKMVH